MCGIQCYLELENHGFFFMAVFMVYFIMKNKSHFFPLFALTTSTTG